VGTHDQHLFVTGLLANSLARINLRTGHVRYLNIGAYPFALTQTDHGHRLAVSLWGSNAVAIVDLHRWKLIGKVSVGPEATGEDTKAGVHPTAIVALSHTADVFVALANVDRVAEVNTATLKTVRIINDGPYPNAPPGI
jgi:hypothetical protein